MNELIWSLLTKVSLLDAASSKTTSNFWPFVGNLPMILSSCEENSKYYSPHNFSIIFPSIIHCYQLLVYISILMQHAGNWIRCAIEFKQCLRHLFCLPHKSHKYLIKIFEFLPSCIWSIGNLYPNVSFSPSKPQNKFKVLSYYT